MIEQVDAAAAVRAVAGPDAVDALAAAACQLLVALRTIPSGGAVVPASVIA